MVTGPSHLAPPPPQAALKIPTNRLKELPQEATPSGILYTGKNGITFVLPRIALLNRDTTSGRPQIDYSRRRIQQPGDDTFVTLKQDSGNPEVFELLDSGKPYGNRKGISLLQDLINGAFTKS